MSSFYPEDVLIVFIKTLIDFDDPPDRFTADREKIHTALYKISKNQPSLRQTFLFRNNGFFYESEPLDQALNNLNYCEVLDIIIRQPPCYYINQAAIKTCYKKPEQRLLPDELINLQKLSILFWKELY